MELKKKLIARIFFPVSLLSLVLLLVSCNEFTREQQLEMLRLNQPIAESDMTVSQLIEQMQKAIDPEKKFYNTKKYLMKQQTISEKEAEKKKISTIYVTEIRYSQPDKIRWTHFQNQVPFNISICKDGQAWDIDPDRKKCTKLPEGLELNLFRTTTDMANPTKTYLDIFKTVEISSVYEDDVRCYRLVCQAYDERIAPYVIYVNAETFLPIKAETIVYGGDGIQSLYTSIPTEYKWFANGAVKLPTKTIIKTSFGQDISTILDFSLTPNIPDSDFELPQQFRVDQNAE